MPRPPPPPLLIAGVGKGTLIKRLLEQEPGQYVFSVSVTTRAPREGERVRVGEERGEGGPGFGGGRTGAGLRHGTCGRAGAGRVTAGGSLAQRAAAAAADDDDDAAAARPPARPRPTPGPPRWRAHAVPSHTPLPRPPPS
jgi:hypothetical protein